MSDIQVEIFSNDPDIALIDVGHGNCALIEENDTVTLIDAGMGRTVVETLKQRGIKHVDRVLISHADSDHVGGLLTLLLDPELTIGAVYCNSDSVKNTRMWRRVVYALEDVAAKKGTTLTPALTTSTHFDSGEIELQILAPTPWAALTGPGTKNREGRKMSGNTLSAVIRVVRRGVPIVLLAGDIDGVALDDLRRRGVSLEAGALVFPHHGGWPGSADAAKFAKDLCRLVQPQILIFSIGRGEFDTPRPEIIAGIRAAVPRVHIVCTQLSERCAPTLPDVAPTHLSGRVARGEPDRACCGGTLVLDTLRPSVLRAPAIDSHLAFIYAHAPTAVCLGGRSTDS